MTLKERNGTSNNTAGRIVMSMAIKERNGVSNNTSPSALCSTRLGKPSKISGMEKSNIVPVRVQMLLGIPTLSFYI